MKSKLINVNEEIQHIGKEWISLLPKGWKADRIKDVCENLVSGGTPKSSITEFWDDGDVIWLSPTDFSKQKGKKYITDSEKKITKLGLKSSSATLIPTGTIIMSSRASIGEAKIAGCELSTNQGFISFIPNFRVHNNFLFYAIEGHLGTYFNSISSGTTFNEISRRMVKQENMPVPPIPEQKIIAEYLDFACSRIDRIIAIKKEQLKNIEKLKNSEIHKCCTKGLLNNVELVNYNSGHIGKYPKHWRVQRIKRGCKKIDTGGTPKSSVPEYYENGNIEWYAPECFNDGLTIDKPKKLINELAVFDNEIKMYPSNSVFYVCVGATAGKVGIIRKPASCNQQINILQTNFKLIPEFLAYQLKILEKEIIKFAQYTTLPILNQAKTGYIQITFPPIEEQKNIVEHLNLFSDNLYKAKEKIIKQIEVIKSYRKSLIHECVTGKKQVSDIASEKHNKKANA